MLLLLLRKRRSFISSLSLPTDEPMKDSSGELREELEAREVRAWRSSALVLVLTPLFRVVNALKVEVSPLVPKTQLSRGQGVAVCPQNIGLENVVLRRDPLSSFISYVCTITR